METIWINQMDFDFKHNPVPQWIASYTDSNTFYHISDKPMFDINVDALWILGHECAVFLQRIHSIPLPCSRPSDDRLSRGLAYSHWNTDKETRSSLLEPRDFPPDSYRCQLYLRFLALRQKVPSLLKEQQSWQRSSGEDQSNKCPSRRENSRGGSTRKRKKIWKHNGRTEEIPLKPWIWLNLV